MADVLDTVRLVETSHGLLEIELNRSTWPMIRRAFYVTSWQPDGSERKSAGWFRGWRRRYGDGRVGETLAEFFERSFDLPAGEAAELADRVDREWVAHERLSGAAGEDRRATALVATFFLLAAGAVGLAVLGIALVVLALV